MSPNSFSKRQSFQDSVRSSHSLVGKSALSFNLSCWGICLPHQKSLKYFVNLYIIFRRRPSPRSCWVAAPPPPLTPSPRRAAPAPPACPSPCLSCPHQVNISSVLHIYQFWRSQQISPNFNQCWFLQDATRHWSNFNWRFIWTKYLDFQNQISELTS